MTEKIRIEDPTGQAVLEDRKMTPEEEQAFREECVAATKRQERQIWKNAQRGCSRCPGYCCLTFSLSFAKKEIPGLIRKRKAEIAKIREAMETRRRMDVFYHGAVRKPRQYAWDQEAIESFELDIKDLRLWDKLLITLRMSPDYMKRVEGMFRANKNFYTCRAFDVKTNRCTRYEERPSACPKFLCPEAKQGKAPKLDGMLSCQSVDPRTSDALWDSPIRPRLSVPRREL